MPSARRPCDTERGGRALPDMKAVSIWETLSRAHTRGIFSPVILYGGSFCDLRKSAGNEEEKPAWLRA